MNGKLIYLLVFIWGLVISCQNEELDMGKPNVELGHHVSISLGVASTKGPITGISNATILVYGEESNDPIRYSYVSGSDDANFTLPDGTWRFLILGNTLNELESIDLDDVTSYSVPMEELISEESLPVSIDTTLVVNSDARLQFQLKHILSKLDVRVNLSTELEDEVIRSVQLRNVPKQAMFFNQSFIDDSKIDLPVIFPTNSRSMNVSLYLPEQHLGYVESITSPKQRTMNNAPEGAMFLELMLHNPETGQIYSYRLPVGEDQTSSFEIDRSSNYKMDLLVSEVDSDDPREETWIIRSSDNYDEKSYETVIGTIFTAMENGKVCISTLDERIKNLPLQIKVQLLDGDIDEFYFNGLHGNESIDLNNVVLGAGREYELRYCPSVFSSSNSELSYRISAFLEDQLVFEKDVSYSFYNHLKVYGVTSSGANVVGASVSAVDALYSMSSNGSDPELLLHVFNKEGDVALEAIPSSNTKVGSWYSGNTLGGPLIGSGSVLSYTFSSANSSIIHKFLPR